MPPLRCETRCLSIPSSRLRNHIDHVPSDAIRYPVERDSTAGEGQPDQRPDEVAFAINFKNVTDMRCARRAANGKGELVTVEGDQPVFGFSPAPARSGRAQLNLLNALLPQG